MKAAADSRLSVLAWVVALGGTGFTAGFFGPIGLNPDANQGPLVGLLITGPFSALAGLALGAICRFVSLTRSAQLRALALACSLLGLGTLYYCLPDPKVRGYVIAPPSRAVRRPRAHSQARSRNGSKPSRA